MNLELFASSRALKKYFEAAKEKEGLIDAAMSVGEFLGRVCVGPGRRANSYETLLLMQRAAGATARLEKELGISADFFAFLKNYEYLFSFFKELSIEKKGVEDLKNNDFYASYNEHLEILGELYKNYLKLLDERGLYDEISLPLKYDLNLAFLENYERIIYHLPGFLSRFERELLYEISEHRELILCFKTSKFNVDYFADFWPDLKADLRENFYYELSLKKQELIKEEPLINEEISARIKAFEFRSLQVAFVMDEVSRFVRAGLSPDKIVVLTPDEDFCELLRAFDKGKMFNFASGISIRESLFFQKLRVLLEANGEEFFYKKDEDYFKNEGENFDYYNSLLNFLGLDFEAFKISVNSPCSFDNFEKLINFYLKDEGEELREKIEKELFFIQDFLEEEELNLRELLELFLSQISSISLSHVGGGEITVMGLLESRGLSFDGVIIVDFNEDFIPKRSINELFLNNEIRKKAGLISYEKRENLQRFYYESLIKNAKKISISFVENEEKDRSRFLKELDLHYELDDKKNSPAYLRALGFNELFKEPKLTPLPPPKLAHDPFSSPLSFSRLSLFQGKKRTYFYRYILKLAQPRTIKMLDEINEEAAKNMGNFLHKMLENFYRQNQKFKEDDFLKLLAKEYKKNDLNDLDFEILKLRFKDFAKNESEHFSGGYKIKDLELKINKELKIENKKIILTGIIDRVDELGNELFIIDYKSGKIPQKSFQLAFYKLLLDDEEKKIEACFYDLKKMCFDKGGAKSAEELKYLLIELIKEGGEEIIFENEDDSFCPYKLIYKKELK